MKCHIEYVDLLYTIGSYTWLSTLLTVYDICGDVYKDYIMIEFLK